MKHRITAVRVAGAKPDHLDMVAYTYKKVHLVTHRDQFKSIKAVAETLKNKLLSEDNKNLISQSIKQLNDSVAAAIEKRHKEMTK